MKLTLAKKMYGLGALLMAVLLGISITALFLFKSIAKDYEDLIKDDGAQIEHSMRAQIEAERAVQEFNAYLIMKEDGYITKFMEHYGNVVKEISQWEALVEDDDEAALVAKAKNELGKFRAALDKAAGEYQAKDLRAVAMEVMKAEEPLVEALSGLDTIAMKNYETGKESNRARESRLALTMIIIALITIAASALTGIMLIRTTLRSVRNVAEVVQNVSSGDFSGDVPVASDDEIGSMAKGFNEMMENLRRISQQIKGMTTTIASSSEELSSTTNLLTDGARDQARQTEQAATAITEVSQTIMDVAQNASDASASSSEASRIALEGRSKVEATVEGMHQIEGTVREASVAIQELGKSSQEIGNIVRTINDIADQTNLLALNAAIEAARAGEQGRGFAVVADEVRKLAERTGKATMEIGEMIKKIQRETEQSVESMNAGISEVEKGVNLAEEARMAMINIVEAANRGTDMIQRIAVAAEEQSTAAEVVSASMESISNVTRNAESSAGQIQAASQDLARIASELKVLVDWFRL